MSECLHGDITSFDIYNLKKKESNYHSSIPPSYAVSFQSTRVELQSTDSIHILLELLLPYGISQVFERSLNKFEMVCGWLGV